MKTRRFRLMIVLALALLLSAAPLAVAAPGEHKSPSRAHHTLTDSAEGIYVPAADRKDMVYDSIRDIVYVTSGDSVLRFHLASGAFLSPFRLGGYLFGIDLSPDGNTLAVADASTDGTSGVHVYLIDLNTEQVGLLSFARDYMEAGAFTVVFAGDGTLFVTSDFAGSGWVPFRQYNPTNGTTTILRYVRQRTMQAASADGNTVAFAESNASDGPWGYYYVPGSILRTHTTDRFNYEIGVNRDGSQYALPSYSGVNIYTPDFQLVHTVGVGQAAIGVVYSPIEDVVYVAVSGTSEVRAYETTMFSQIATYDVGSVFEWTGNHAFVEGRLRISDDGRILMVTVDGGVQLIHIGSPPSTTIDIKPGEPDNVIDLSERGKMAVAVLSAEGFDAPNDLMRGAFTFGRTGAEKSLLYKKGSMPYCSARDVNGDGLPDLVCQYLVKLTGFQVGDTEGVLVGMTKAGGPFEGRDRVNVVP